MAVKLDAPIYRKQYLVSVPLLEICWSRVRADAEKRGKARAKVLTEMLAVVGGQPSRSGRGGTDCASSATPDEDRGAGMQGKKGKGRRKKEKPSAGPNKGKGNSPRAGGETLAIEIPSAEDLFSLLEQDDQVRQLLACDYLGNPGLDAGGEVLRGIVEEGLVGGSGFGGGGGQEHVTSLYEGAAVAAVTDMETERAAAKKVLEERTVQGLEHAELYSSNAATLSYVSDSAVADSLAGVLEVVCVETAMAIMNFVASSVGVPGSAISGASASALRGLSQRLPPDVANHTRDLVSSVAPKKAGGISHFLAAYDSSAEALGLPVRRPLDKQRERAVNASLRASLDASLSQPSQPSVDALRACAALLHARHADGAVVFIAAHSLPVVCAALEDRAPGNDGAGAALHALRQAVTAQLRKASARAAPPVVGDEIRSLVQAVRTLAAAAPEAAAAAGP